MAASAARTRRYRRQRRPEYRFLDVAADILWEVLLLAARLTRGIVRAIAAGTTWSAASGPAAARPVGMDDLVRAAALVAPSVTPEQLRRFETWHRRHQALSKAG